MSVRYIFNKQNSFTGLFITILDIISIKKTLFKKQGILEVIIESELHSEKY